MAALVYKAINGSTNFNRQYWTVHAFMKKQEQEEVMNRREFIKCSGAFCVAVALGKTSAYGTCQEGVKRCGFPMGMELIDAHAHPDIFPCTQYFCDEASTIEKIKQISAVQNSLKLLYRPL